MAYRHPTYFPISVIKKDYRLGMENRDRNVGAHREVEVERTQLGGACEMVTPVSASASCSSLLRRETSPKALISTGAEADGAGAGT
jgi:hypothetical protein